MADRKAARQALKALMETVTTFVVVYGSEVFDFQRQSPVCMIHGDGSAPAPSTTLGSDQRQHAYIISLWWRRAETTEDDIDDLSAEVFDVLEANGGPANDWAALTIDENFSQLDYPILDGVMYRRERIRVIIW